MVRDTYFNNFFTTYIDMAEQNAMAEKILCNIENIMNSDTDLQEFTIIPTEGNTKNKSPVLYMQHNIGLESWCIKHVYNYACSILFDHRKLLSKRKLSFDKMANLNHLLIGVILINPDVGTFWNMKRELILLDVLDVDTELRFSKIVLSHKSKSNEAFSYRRWLVKRVLDKVPSNDMETSLNLLQNEFVVVNMASEKSPNNYHSWNHRIWCMENIAINSPSVTHIVYSELSYSQEWINTHVSEYSGYNYRQYLLKLVKTHKNIISLFESFYNFVIKHLSIFNDGEHSNLLVYLLGKQSRSSLLEETYSYINYISLLIHDLFIFIHKLNRLYPEHESLFYHRRFIVYNLLEVAHEYHGIEFKRRSKIVESNMHSSNKNIVNSDSVICLKSLSNDQCTQGPKLYKLPISKVEAANLYKLLLNSEKQFLCENLNSTQGSVQNELTKRYQKWLKYVIGFE